MATLQEFNRCAFCFEYFDEETRGHSAHVIPKTLGGCDHPANKVDACAECNNGTGGQWARMPLDWWAKQQWDADREEKEVSQFDYGGWTVEERQQFLLRAAYWEARARWHLWEHHGRKVQLTEPDG